MNLIMDQFYIDANPIIITEARKLPMKAVSWSAITSYYLEYVKINKYNGKLRSTAMIKIGDRSGQVSCLIEGSDIRHLFGVDIETWIAIQKLCSEELFYRYFTDGLSDNFSLEQKVFYYFCHLNQVKDVLFAKFQRGINVRKNEKHRTFLQILEIKKCTKHLLELYVNKIEFKSNNEDVENIRKDLKKQKISDG